jgi:hypothetical protein
VANYVARFRNYLFGSTVVRWSACSVAQPSRGWSRYLRDMLCATASFSWDRSSVDVSSMLDKKLFC